MTLREFEIKIESWPTEEMNFSITDVFSWRGSYNEPACSLSIYPTTKSENLKMISRLYNETFIGWKGGNYEYCQTDEIHFESDDGSYSNGDYLTRFITHNINEEIKHIFG